MASILLPFPPSQHKLVRVSQLEGNTSPCPPRGRSKRVLPGGLVLPRRGSIRRGSAAGKTPQGWKKQKDETGSIQGGDVEDEDSGSAIAGNPREIALMHQTLEKIKVLVGKAPSQQPCPPQTGFGLALQGRVIRGKEAGSTASVCFATC